LTGAAAIFLRITMRGLVWFRRDLRVHDQPALSAALADCEEVLPLFVFDDPLLQSRTFGSASVTFMLDCLRDLARSLGERELPLRWRRGDPSEEIVRAALEWEVGAVYWNRDYEPRAVRRDRTIETALRRRGVAVRTFKDHVVFEAEETRSSGGGPFQRFGAYRTRWRAQWREAQPPLIALPASRPSSRRDHQGAVADLPSAGDLGYETLPLSIRGGETEARKRLRRFLGGPVRAYGAGRNHPALDATSRLSPHFRFGTLSTRTAVHAALAALAKRGPAWQGGVQAWVDELIWRDFFQQVVACFPQVAAGPFRRTTTTPLLRRDPRLFEAWCQGHTGFPLVDAGMRQLNQTGWMHNRVRMVTASFLVKDLRLDWRLGERYFMERLLDADLAANNGNWQWCASTGTDAMPGYRIFNPARQAQAFDPDGAYIRRYVPELADVPPPFIHAPHRMPAEAQARWGCRLGLDYPAPIVDHQQARLRYLADGRRGKPNP
jgi:deoxyribodipyrimidine photo-lyase